MLTDLPFRFVSFLYLVSRSTPALGSSAATHLLVTHVGPCDDTAVLLMTFVELTITTQMVDCLLSGEFNLTEDVANGWKVKATMQKCQDLRNVETCDFLSAFNVVRDGCSEEDQDEDSYNMLFHYANPEIECPIRAGVYKLSNYPLFTEDNFLTVYETKISTSVFGYTFNLEGHTADGQKIFCLEAYLQLYYIREHDWQTSHNKTHAIKYKKHTNEEHFLH